MFRLKTIPIKSNPFQSFVSLRRKPCRPTCCFQEKEDVLMGRLPCLLTNDRVLSTFSPRGSIVSPVLLPSLQSVSPDILYDGRIL